jgi:cell division protein FtsL
MTKYAYCKICDKQVDNPVRKPMETFQKVIWVMLSIATVGVAAIIFAIVYGNRKKVHCPTCRAKVQFTSEPQGKSKKEGEPLTQRERILKKAGKAKEKKATEEKEIPLEEEEEEEEIEQTFCPYCGEDINKGISTCPYCHSSLTIR